MTIRVSRVLGAPGLAQFRGSFGALCVLPDTVVAGNSATANALSIEIAVHGPKSALAAEKRLSVRNHSRKERVKAEGEELHVCVWENREYA